MQVKIGDSSGLHGGIGLGQEDEAGRDQHGDDEICRAAEHKRPQVALQLERGPVDDGNVDTPR